MAQISSKLSFELESSKPAIENAILNRMGLVENISLDQSDEIGPLKIFSRIW